MSLTEPISLVSGWFIEPGCEDAVRAALMDLAEAVRAEAGTLTYLAHFTTGAPVGIGALLSPRPPDPPSLLFYETYRDAAAFNDHVNGATFQNFVRNHGRLFRQVGGRLYTTLQFLDRVAGFVRSSDGEPATAATSSNGHPSVMFEVIARDQAKMKAFYSRVFGWQYEAGTGGFAYIHFPAGSPPLLGGIGQTDPSIPGFEPGRNFYLLVDALQPVLDRAFAAGATALMPPSAVDGYNFAMFVDPEGNPIGLIEPFTR